MPLPEMYDYIKLINEQNEKEIEATEWKTSESNKEDPKMFSDVFKNIGNPLKK